MAVQDLDYIKVVGRLADVTADSDDLGDDPDINWCTAGKVKLTPLIPVISVLNSEDSPWTASVDPITLLVGSDGRLELTLSGDDYAKVVDLTSTKITPYIGEGQATHLIEFINLKAGTKDVLLPSYYARIAPDTIKDGDDACDISLIRSYADVPNIKFVSGIKGDQGDPGPANTLSVGTVAKGPGPYVGITGESPNQVINFVLPQGDKGDQGNPGPPNTLSIGTVTTVSNLSDADAGITGTSPNQILNLSIPKGAKGDKGDPGTDGTNGTDGTDGAPGPANTLSVGTVTGGDTADANITGDSPNQTLNLTLPKGDKGDQGNQGDTGNPGPPNTLSIGTVTKDVVPDANITGDSPNQTLNLTLPQGDKGDQGDAGPPNILTVADTITLDPGLPADVTIAGDTPNQSLTFSIPKGEQGIQGNTGAAGKDGVDAYPIVVAEEGTVNPSSLAEGTLLIEYAP